MLDRYLLYIDVLGFSALMEEGARRIDDLFEAIASLYAHQQTAFRAIVFSDTVLVYNTLGNGTPRDRSLIIMFLCEFAQDLQQRLTGRKIFFRAVLVKGQFTHYDLNGIPCFYGSALVRAHHAEKTLPAIGLFMETTLAAESRVYRTVSFTDEYSFVFVTQGLETLERMWDGAYSVDPFKIEGSDLIHILVPDLLFIRDIREMSTSHPDERVRQKHTTALGILRARYPVVLGWLDTHGFDITSISPAANWAGVIDRYPEAYTWAIKTRMTY